MLKGSGPEIRGVARTVWIRGHLDLSVSFEMNRIIVEADVLEMAGIGENAAIVGAEGMKGR